MAESAIEKGLSQNNLTRYKWSYYYVNNQSLHFTNGEVYFDMIKVPNTDFYIGETPVTQSLWTSVMGNNPSHFKGSLNCPVENVSHKDCISFINVLNEQTGKVFHLPSQREWVLAAKGGENKLYSFAGSDDPYEVGWFDNRTHPVKLKRPNRIGIYDMSGNVWEWTSDVAPERKTIKSQSKEQVIKPNGDKEIPTYYYLKGGSCMNGPRTSKLISTNSFGEYYSNWHLGLRLALYVF